MPMRAPPSPRPTCPPTRSYGLPWSFASCGFADFIGWADAADAVLAERGFDLSQYKHRVYMLPFGAPCPWAGLGYLGAPGHCVH